MNFAITLKLNRRVDFDNDVNKLRDALFYLTSFTAGRLAPHRFELQPTGLNNMHVHVLLTTEHKFSFFDVHNMMKKKDINCDIKQLITKTDIDKWAYYCVKNKGGLAYQYAETTGSELNKIRIFDHNETAQQKVDQAMSIPVGRYGKWK